MCPLFCSTAYLYHDVTIDEWLEQCYADDAFDPTTVDALLSRNHQYQEEMEKDGEEEEEDEEEEEHRHHDQVLRHTIASSQDT